FAMHAPRTMRLLFVVAILVTAAPSIGRFEIGAQTNREPNFQERYPRYRLRPGDVLELNFLFSPEFNQNVVIQPDGYVNLRGVATWFLCQNPCSPSSPVSSRCRVWGCILTRSSDRQNYGRH